MALGSTQPVTEMMLRGVKAAGAQVDNIVTFFISVFSLWYHHTYRCDDTRVMQFWPPDDEHMCLKHVEAWNKTYCETNFVHQVG